MELTLRGPQLVGKIDVQQHSPKPVRRANVEAQCVMSVGIGETSQHRQSWGQNLLKEERGQRQASWRCVYGRGRSVLGWGHLRKLV